MKLGKGDKGFPAIVEVFPAYMTKSGGNNTNNIHHLHWAKHVTFIIVLTVVSGSHYSSF